jgi:hypothetical protein
MQPGSSPLDQLADIHLPGTVSWWPLAVGWWILALLVVIILTLVILWRKRQLKRRYRQHAATLLQTAYSQYQTDGHSSIYLQQLSELLRRVARTSYGKIFNPSIKGEDWLVWLDQSCPGLKTNFVSDTGRVLLTGPYQKNPQLELDVLHQLSLQWIRYHSTKSAVCTNLKQGHKPVANNEVAQHV